MNLLWKLAMDRSPERHANEKHREVSVRAGVTLRWETNRIQHHGQSFCPSSYSQHSYGHCHALCPLTHHLTRLPTLPRPHSDRLLVCTLTVYLPHPSSIRQFTIISLSYQTLATLSWASSDEDDDGWLRGEERGSVISCCCSKQM